MSKHTDRRRRQTVDILLVIYYILICLLCVGEFAVPVFHLGPERVTYFRFYKQMLTFLPQREPFSLSVLPVWDAFYTFWSIFIIFILFIWMVIQHCRSHIRHWMSMIHIALSGIGFLLSVHFIYYLTYVNRDNEISTISVSLSLVFLCICLLNSVIFILNRHYYDGNG